MVNRLTFSLGQLRVEFEGEAAVIHGPGGAGAEVEVEVEPGEEALRHWVRHDDAGRYRPLPGAANMRTGWQVRSSRALPLTGVLDIVYPLAMQHIEQTRAGTLDVVALQTVLARQTGRYGRAVTLPEDARELAAAVLCGRCVKQPLWRGAGVQAGQIPCPEPCSVMVSLCRDAALWESERPSATAVDSGVAWAAFETAGNEIREHYLRERFESGDQVVLSDE